MNPASLLFLLAVVLVLIGLKLRLRWRLGLRRRPAASRHMAGGGTDPVCDDIRSNRRHDGDTDSDRGRFG